jgi:hypothetical protein
MMGGANVTYRLADGERLKIVISEVPATRGLVTEVEWRVSGVGAFVSFIHNYMGISL